MGQLREYKFYELPLVAPLQVPGTQLSLLCCHSTPWALHILLSLHVPPLFLRPLFLSKQEAAAHALPTVLTGHLSYWCRSSSDSSQKVNRELMQHSREMGGGHILAILATISQHGEVHSWSSCSGAWADSSPCSAGEGVLCTD